MDEQKLFKYLDAKFTNIQADLCTLKSDVGTLKTDVATFKDSQLRLDKLAKTQADDTHTLMKLTYGKIEEIQKELNKRDEFSAGLKMAVRAACK